MRLFFQENLRDYKNLNLESKILFLLSISVFLPTVFSNILLLISVFVYISKKTEIIVFRNYSLILLLLYFLLIFLSYFISINPEITLKSIPRNVFLVFVPLFLTKTFYEKPSQKEIILNLYSIGCFFVILYFTLRACIRFLLTNDSSHFFFHGEYNNDYGLVPKELNAIHVSVFVAIAFLYLLQKEKKSKFEIFISFFFLLAIILLSSSVIIFSVALLSSIYYFFFSKVANKMRLRNIVLLTIIIAGFSFYNKISKILEVEIKTNTQHNIGHNVINNIPDLDNKVTIYEAWNKEKFSQNDFFPGTAFRVYQFRIFLEIIKEQDAFWTGLGFNASQQKIREKGVEYNVFQGNHHSEGYQNKNFHNQYLQVFSELGFIGFALLIIILLFNLKTAIKNKDFLHIAFAILMISLFLTESFLSRQRGVVFFTVFYCLFTISNNTRYIKNNTK